jgi:hypothetical protein
VTGRAAGASAASIVSNSGRTRSSSVSAKTRRTWGLALRADHHAQPAGVDEVDRTEVEHDVRRRREGGRTQGAHHGLSDTRGRRQVELADDGDDLPSLAFEVLDVEEHGAAVPGSSERRRDRAVAPVRPTQGIGHLG